MKSIEQVLDLKLATIGRPCMSYDRSSEYKVNQNWTEYELLSISGSCLTIFICHISSLMGIILYSTNKEYELTLERLDIFEIRMEMKFYPNQWLEWKSFLFISILKSNFP